MLANIFRPQPQRGRGGISIRTGLQNRRPVRELWVQIPPPLPPIALIALRYSSTFKCVRVITLKEAGIL